MSKSILIIGGTGTLGKAIIENAIAERDVDSITVLSRDEQKQQSLKKTYPNIKFIIGDIKDKESIKRAFTGIDMVFHVAALKHIDVCEDNPIESVKTNILGTINVAECCIDSKVKKVMFSSTDKAVDPINVYGNCKAISESILNNFNQIQKETKFYNFRWGNVLNSNGSAIPYFIKLLKENKPIPITDASMTRFFITIDEAVSFIFSTMLWKTNPTPVEIPNTMKATSMVKIVYALASIMRVTPVINIVGKRKGEKVHEALITAHSSNHINSESCIQYTDEELEFLLRPLVNGYSA